MAYYVFRVVYLFVVELLLIFFIIVQMFLCQLYAVWTCLLIYSSCCTYIYLGEWVLWKPLHPRYICNQ
jgi:hypothetical protein